MQRDLCAYLNDVMTAANAITEFTANATIEDLQANDLLRSGVERKFEIIGEALNQAAVFFPKSVDSIPNLSLAIGQRHRIIHGYFTVNHKRLWVAIENDLPPLKKAVLDLINVNCEGF